jgi:3,2-trans-enoyl-CoA isomerase
MVLCSSLETIFCAGLDLTELYKPDADRLPKFWESTQQVYIDLYGSRLATVAAIAGHAPAAGCMLALVRLNRSYNNPSPFIAFVLTQSNSHSHV